MCDMMRSRDLLFAANHHFHLKTLGTRNASMNLNLECGVSFREGFEFRIKIS